MADEQSVLLYGALGGERGRPVIVAVDGDGRLVIRDVQFALDQRGDERIVRAENDGTPRGQVVLWDYTGGQQIRAAGEPATGQAMVSLYGTDPTNTLAALRTDAARIYRQRGFEPWRFVDTVEPAPGGGYATVYTVPATSLAVIEWRVVSTLGTPEIDVHAVENAGAPDTSNAEVIGASPLVGCLPMRAGPIQLEAGGTIQCRNTAAAGNTGNVRVWVELYSTGDAVA